MRRKHVGMSIRNAVLVVDEKGDASNQISEELRKQGYHTVCVGQAETFLPLIESRDRIYTMVFVDKDFSPEAAGESIKRLKQLGPGVPIVFTTAENVLQKEKEVRKSGVFFYHVKGDGMEELIKAVVSAMEDAIMKDNFIPGFDG